MPLLRRRGIEPGWEAKPPPRPLDFGRSAAGLPTETVERIIRPEEYHWRTGRKVGRTIYLVANLSGDPSDDDPLIGTMDTPELAAEAVRAHNLDIDIRASR